MTALSVCAISTLISGCASLATNAAANALSGTGTVFAGDDDPELIADAAPFGLKTMEAVLEETPEHKGLLLALSAGYAQYGYAFLQEKADAIREDEYERAAALDARAAKLYGRARAYGLRGLNVLHEGFEKQLREQPERLRSELKEDDVPFLFWTAASWALVIRASQYAPDAIADFPLVLQLAQWGLELNANWDDGALHVLMVTIESSRPGGRLDTAEGHFRKALELDQGRRAGTYLAMAENVCVTRQDLKCFREHINAAMAIDANEHPADRLVNVIMQRRAKRLRNLEEDLFLVEDVDDASQDELD